MSKVKRLIAVGASAVAIGSGALLAAPSAFAATTATPANVLAGPYPDTAAGANACDNEAETLASEGFFAGCAQEDGQYWVFNDA